MALFLVGGLLVWAVTRSEPRPAPDLVRFAIVPPDTDPLDLLGRGQDLAISRDGTQVVYQSVGPGGPQLNLRPIDQLVGAPLRGTAGAAAPFVSADGQWVGFNPSLSTGTLLKVSIFGGPPVTLTESSSEIAGASWGSDDQIVHGTASAGLFRVAAGGEAEVLTTLETDRGETAHGWPFVIPDRQAVVFVASSGRTLNTGQLAVLDLNTREVTRLGLAGLSPHYVSTGHLVFAAEDGSVRAVPFDAASLEVTGNPVPLVEGVVVKPSGAASFSISDNGRLVYATAGGRAAERHLVWLDHEGHQQPTGLPPDTYQNARLSPDGRQVSLLLAGRDNLDVWVGDVP